MKMEREKKDDKSKEQGFIVTEFTEPKSRGPRKSGLPDLDLAWRWGENSWYFFFLYWPQIIFRQLFSK